MIVRMDGDSIRAVEEILRQGKDAVIRRYGQGIIVEETKRKIRYSTYPIADKERAIKAKC